MTRRPVERELSALRETAVATVRYGVEKLPDDALVLCKLVAEYASDRAQQLPDGDRVAVFAHAIRTLLDDAPDAYCALDRVTRPRRHPGNHKYVFGLDRVTRRALPASLPYPRLTLTRGEV